MIKRGVRLLANGVLLGTGVSYIVSRRPIVIYSKQDGQKMSSVVPQQEQQKETFFADIDLKFDQDPEQQKEAYSILLSKKQEYESDANFLWRLAKASYRMSGMESDKEKAKQLVKDSTTYAAEALKLDDSNANVYKWSAISLSEWGKYEGTKQKILNGYTVKEHIDKSIALDGTDYSVHHVLGRWCFEVYRLTWAEKKIASVLFATPPSATIEEALAAFLEAERLNPRSYIANMLYIAKCYYEMKNKDEELKWLDYGREGTAKTRDDKECLQAIEKMRKAFPNK